MHGRRIVTTNTPNQKSTYHLIDSKNKVRFKIIPDTGKEKISTKTLRMLLHS